MIKIRSDDFDIAQIAHSGQCFRIFETETSVWEVAAFGKILRIKAPDGKNSAKYHYFDCTQEDYDAVWRDYFDMDYNYGEIKDKIRNIGDQYLTNAVNFGHGIRILNQDLWEVIVSFIISQQNNIQRITKIIKNLCAPYEDRHFPSPEELARYSDDDFVELGLGYRAKYVRDVAIAVVEGALSLDHLKLMDYDEAITTLKQLNGVGDKVANCIALFGLRQLDAFPIDVWIKRILQEQYGGSFDISRFPGYAGIVQQYMFFYERFREKSCFFQNSSFFNHFSL